MSLLAKKAADKVQAVNWSNILRIALENGTATISCLYPYLNARRPMLFMNLLDISWELFRDLKNICKGHGSTVLGEDSQ